MLIFVFLISILNLKTVVESARVLGIFPVPAPSHYILGSTIMEELANRGHDVTFISPFSPKSQSKNGKLREIQLTGFIEAAEEKRKDIALFDHDNINPFIVYTFMHKMLLELSENTLDHTNVQQLMKSNKQFDVIIVEQFMNEALKAFALYYKAPLVLISTVGANSWINLVVGNPAPPSYIPALFLSYSSKMSFPERLVNSLFYLYSEILNKFYVFPQHAELVRKKFPGGIDLYDILYNASIVLLNSHPSTNQPVPHVPSMVDIGGFHVKPPQSLPKDLQEFLDGAKQGVIYFSLGSNLKSSQLPMEKRSAILKVFSKLKQKVLWKWETDDLPGKPANVKLGKWLPQQDILAHPNVKLFITHGGLLSTTETIYHGVPVLAIPVFGDQKINAQNIVNSGFGLALSYRDVTEQSLMTKIKELLDNPHYTIHAKRRSKIFHDRPNEPLNTAMYWIEYVIKHKGAPHLKVAAVDLPLYQYFLLDVTAFILISIVIAFYILRFILRKMCSLCCTNRRVEKLKNM